MTTIDTAESILDDVLDALGLGDDGDCTDEGRMAAIRCIRRRLDAHADETLAEAHERHADERHWHHNAGARS
jgi:hypothetical protein